MKNLMLAVAALSSLFNYSTACDKCRNPYHVAYVMPSSVIAPSAAAYVPMTYSVPMAYSATMSVAPLTVAAPMTYTMPSVSSVQMMQAPISTVSVAPTYYTVPTVQSGFHTQSFVPQSTVYYTDNPQSASVSSAQTQGFVSDLILGLARPAACEVCKNLGCGTGNGNSSTDPIASLRETIEEIGKIIKAVKGLEKDIKENIGKTIPEVEIAPAAQDSQIAELTALRDDIRAMNQGSETTTRVAADRE